ncbi:hypothetical protein LZ554_005797 [Drepanopeziza brunnea f. sp. 'monogermtubi']|nr:hypothetical protein LZ554_005797 [Drepanopeziza brunnea f. sp. 'monogermtubi']
MSSCTHKTTSFQACGHTTNEERHVASCAGRCQRPETRNETSRGICIACYEGRPPLQQPQPRQSGHRPDSRPAPLRGMGGQNAAAERWRQDEEEQAERDRLASMAARPPRQETGQQASERQRRADAAARRERGEEAMLPRQQNVQQEPPRHEPPRQEPPRQQARPSAPRSQAWRTQLHNLQDPSCPLWERVDGDNTDCCACLLELEPGQDVVQLPCGSGSDGQHRGHRACLVHWLQSNPTCPQCRQRFNIAVDRNRPQRRPSTPEFSDPEAPVGRLDGPFDGLNHQPDPLAHPFGNWNPFTDPQGLTFDPRLARAFFPPFVPRTGGDALGDSYYGQPQQPAAAGSYLDHQRNMQQQSQREEEQRERDRRREAERPAEIWQQAQQRVHRPQPVGGRGNRYEEERVLYDSTLFSNDRSPFFADPRLGEEGREFDRRRAEQQRAAERERQERNTREEADREARERSERTRREISGLRSEAAAWESRRERVFGQGVGDLTDWSANLVQRNRAANRREAEAEEEFRAPDRREHGSERRLREARLNLARIQVRNERSRVERDFDEVLRRRDDLGRFRGP